MDAMAEIRQTFFEECADGLAELEQGLLHIENGATDYETVNTAFRAVHSIKGGAASFSLTALSTYAHMFEAVLDEMRAGRLATSPEVVALARRASALLADLVAEARDGAAGHDERRRAMMEELQPLAGAKGAAIAAAAAAGAEPDDGMEGLEFIPVSIDLSEMFGGAFESRFRVVFRPQPELYRNANEAARLIRDCLALGHGTVTCDTGGLPSFETLDPEGAYLTWTIDLTAVADEGAVREVFEFVDWDCELGVERIVEEMAEEEADEGMPDASIDATFAELLSRIQSETPSTFVADEEEGAAQEA
ncbi:Hpt domain-containing protein [Aureimonas leprariae]|uniref:HPt domain-containing protein n=1 Tax=Plantimonas leprariae TaxID=2615207 RepID=A0A7V7PMJ7_9HYPH|nr:Hpt domain-containing protein [Aureimonas leprariae]KAB0678438.1 hypothetical protein F6X38_15480 [Aureimonas leprariae]